jgi:transposase
MEGRRAGNAHLTPFTGGITIVKDYVASWRQRTQEMFVPLVHPPGHAQADFGEAIGVIGGVERKIHFFAFDLPQSDAGFVVGYPAETTEAFCDGHVRAFAFFGGVPRCCMTTPRSRWPASSVTASGNGRACSPSCNRTTYLRIGLADPERVL